MLGNRSVPANVILPHLVYGNVADAILWLENAFGFVEHFRYGSPDPAGAQMHLGEAWIMLRAARPGEASPAMLGAGTQCLTVFVEDVEARYEQARAAGAEIVEELHVTIYGDFQFVAKDLEGHRWIFARHALDTAPEEWGARVAK